MNIAFKSLATTALLIASAHTFAASSVDLTVKGLITPSACTPALRWRTTGCWSASRTTK